MDEHKKFLADRLLSEEQPVSFPSNLQINTQTDRLDHISLAEQSLGCSCEHGERVSTMDLGQ
jgi:hypothetical protein